MTDKQYDFEETPWGGDVSKIPQDGVIVAIDLASSGLANRKVCGYVITYYDDKPQIRIKMCGFQNGETASNERFLQELQTPLTVREKYLLDKMANLKSRKPG